MATIIQITLPLICIILVEGHLELQMPYFGIDIDGPKRDLRRDDQGSWYHHPMELRRYQDHSDGNMVYNRHDTIHRPFDPFNPYLNDAMDHQSWPFGLGNFGPVISEPYPMPENHYIFNKPDFNPHRGQTSGEINGDKKSKQDYEDKEKPRQDHDKDDKHPKQLSPDDKKPSSQDTDSKLNTASQSDIKNNPEKEMPPTPNLMKQHKLSKDYKGKDDKNITLEKKKDYLLVGQGNNGHNVYLLHENKPNPSTIVIPSGNQPGNNIIYVPYNPAQSNNQVYQVVNAQTAPLLTNSQLTPNKLNVITNPVAPAPSSTSPNPNYVLVYSNGQVIQIPGVVINPAQNNMPPQNRNLEQGSNYILATQIPNNAQNSVYYAAIPNQATNGQIVIQIPNCINSVANNPCGSNAVVVNSAQGVNNAANVVNNPPSQNVVLQPAVMVPSSVSNEYGQPNMVANQGQPLNVAVSEPNQRPLTNQNVPIQSGIATLVNGMSSGYNQPTTTNQGAQLNQITNPNISLQPPGAQPMVTNSGPQGANAVNVPTLDTSPNQSENEPSAALPASSVPDDGALVSETDNLSSLRAEPAVMISGFKDTTSNTKDQRKNKGKENRKAKKDKSKKKHKQDKVEGENDKVLKTNDPSKLIS